MKYGLATKVRAKLEPVREIDQVKITAVCEYHLKGDDDWLWFSEEEVTELFDVVEEDESPNG